MRGSLLLNNAALPKAEASLSTPNLECFDLSELRTYLARSNQRGFLLTRGSLLSNNVALPKAEARLSTPKWVTTVVFLVHVL